jgi:uncharacterized protein (TIGR02246 family)
MKLLALAFVLASSSAYAAPDESQTVKSLSDNVVAAELKGDTAALDKLFADDMTFTHGSGLVETKSVFLDALKTGKRKMESVQQTDVQVRMFGTTALVVGNSNVKVVAGGNTIEHAVRFSDIWVQQQGKWRMVAYQATIIAPKPAAKSK